jgi:hypothetical protein
MSLASPVGALTRTKILACVSAANTAAATSGWIDARGYEGAVAVEISVGIITGTLDLTFNTNTASSDTGATAVVPVGGALAQVTTSNDDAIYTAVFEATQLRGYIKVIGTVGTGPSLISYTLIGRKKYAG